MSSTWGGPLWGGSTWGGSTSGSATLPTIQAGQGLLYPALRKAGVTLGPGRTPSPPQFQDAIDELNRLVGSLSCDRLFIYSRATAVFPLTGSKSYTIGIPADPSFVPDFLAPRPQAIESANIISGALRYPLRIVTDLQWAKIGIQDIAGTFSDVLYNDRGYPVSTLYLWGQPAAGCMLELFFWQLVPYFLAPDDQVLLPPGYEDALVLNLAVRLAPHFQRRIDPALRQDARESLMRLESINAPQPVADLSWGPGLWGYRCDGYGGGMMGTSGGSSTSGGTGTPGPAGPAGPAGPQGIPGPAGPQGPQGPAGSAGGVNTVPFSATPTFNLALGMVQQITLTGNVTSVTLSNGTPGVTYTLLVIQDGAGGHTFDATASIRGAFAPGTDANSASSQEFAFDGTTYYAVSNGAINL